MNTSGEKLPKDKKQVRALVCHNNLPLRIYTLALPMSCSNKDNLLRNISKTILSIDEILKDKENWYNMVFKDGTVRLVEMTTNVDPCYTCDCKINIIPPKNRPYQFYNDSSLLNNKSASDFTFIVDGKKILANKLILGTRSPVFWGMFMCEPRRYKIEVKDVDYDTMYDMLHFLYVGEFKDVKWLFTDEVVVKCAKLLEADSLYCVLRLKEECEQRLMNALSTNNSADCLILADKYNIFNLREAAIKRFVLMAKKSPELISEKLAKLHSQLVVDIAKAMVV